MKKNTFLFAQLKNCRIFTPVITTTTTTTMGKREFNTAQAKHHLARLEMMMLEERGIFISYEEALKLVEDK